MSSSPSKLADAPTKALVFSCPWLLSTLHHRMQLSDYPCSPYHRSSSEHYSIPCTMNIDQNIAASDTSMVVESRLESTVDPRFQQVVTNGCNVSATYATADAPPLGFPPVNNDFGPVIAYDGQSCLGPYLHFPDARFIQEPQMLERPVFQQLQPRGLIYGRPPFPARNFPRAELGYQADSKTISQRVQAPQGEL